MKFIREKKVNSAILIVGMYLSFCASFWYTSRGNMAYTSYSLAGSVQSMVMTNEIASFFIGGLVPLLIYELFTSFAFKFTQARLGAVADDMRYSLRFFYIPANLVCFGLKMFYLLTPLASVFGNIIIDFVISAMFVVWFLFYCAKHFVQKEKWGAMLYQLGGTFIMFYAVIITFNLIMGVIL